MICKPGNLLRMLVNSFRRKRFHVNRKAMMVIAFFVIPAFVKKAGFLFLEKIPDA